MTIQEAKEECWNRVLVAYECLEANVDRKYLTAQNYQTAIRNVVDDMIREGLIREEDRQAVTDQVFP